MERSRRGADELRGFMEREATKAAAAAAAAARERARNAAAREIEAATEGGGTAAGLPDDYRCVASIIGSGCLLLLTSR